LIAAGCFYLAFRKIAAAAALEGLSVIGYLGRFFEEANWLAWLALMVPYSVFFLLIDSFVTCKAIRWFNAPVHYLEVLPIRASAYILALLNEQVGKGAIAVYLHRRYRVPGWEVGSTMLFIAFTELYTLLVFSSFGTFMHLERVREASSALPLDRILPIVFAAAAVYFVVHLFYFAGRFLPGVRLRERPLLHAFRRARWWHYGLLLLFKAPNLWMAVLVYTVALRLFRVDIHFGQVLAFLPVIFLAAALPLPFHAGALALWTVLFPHFPQVGAFSLVMHSFFVVFNAVIGVLFLPKVNRELFVGRTDAAATDPPSKGPS
jgi:hypothetical protein